MTEFELTVIGIAIGVIGTVLAIVGILIQRLPDKLELDLIDGTFGDVDSVDNQNLPSRFFHVAVRNNHKRRIARNCYAFLMSLKNAKTGDEYVKQSSELKWRGYQEPFVSILPQTYRKFDSFWVMKSQPDFLIMNTFLDSTQFIPLIKGQLALIAEYWVVSETFKTSKGTFVISLDKDLDKVSLNKN